MDADGTNMIRLTSAKRKMESLPAMKIQAFHQMEDL